MSVTSRTKGKYAFLASTWASPDMKRLRKDIHALEGEGARSVWVSEIDAPELKREKGYGPLAIVDRCLDEIENAEIFFLVVNGEFGSSIELDGKEAPSSYIELELFQAVMHEKPIHVIVVGDIAENSPVDRLIDMISFGVGQEIERVSTHTKALETAARILQPYRWQLPFLGRRNKRILSGRLALQHHHDFANRALFSEIQFLKGKPYFVGQSVADSGTVETLSGWG